MNMIYSWVDLPVKESSRAVQHWVKRGGIVSAFVSGKLDQYLVSCLSRLRLKYDLSPKEVRPTDCNKLEMLVLLRQK